MDNVERDHQYTEVTENIAPAHEQHGVTHDVPVLTTRRLRDRTLLKKRKEEAQEKNTFLWVFGEQPRSKRSRKTNGRGKRKHQVKELEPEPEPEPKPEFHPEPELHAEPEVSHEHTEFVQEHSEHQEDPVSTVTENVTLIIHEEEDDQVPHFSSPSNTVEDVVPEAKIEPVVEAPEDLTFPLDAEQEKQQYYTALL
ncbi:Hypothetical predicted protein [Pelobates cultripes]|uniref:Hemogen n=1 Tax=Pelobates cultripes TaxID=61616 RepID=A0AAD1S793_PELCU|nr:Hypothetical predicted protein [Pelobates cultripes]